MSQKNEERVQQSERDARARNIIIHGFPECAESPDNQNEVDAGLITQLMNILGSGVTPNSICRLGRKTNISDGRPVKRPIKLTMVTSNDKQSFMNNLGRLKNAPDNFKRISITDDYTQEERNSIKAKVDEAKNMTETQGEGKYIWRVRGTPKNGLVLKRFTKINSCVPLVMTNPGETIPINKN